MNKRKVFISLLISCALGNCAMTKTEIEEFSDFLEKTSSMDILLKDGFNNDDEGEDDATDHAWEDSGRFEGDIILNERQRKVIVEDVAEGLSRNGLRDTTKRWPNNEVIYYIQREHFSEDQLAAIKEGIDDIARSSCITFRPYRKGDRDAVVVQGNRRGCFSQVGYQGGYQVLNLSRRHPVSRGCFRHGTIVHEFLHALGFYHMQSSPDRDDYIDIKWENIIEPARHNFKKYNSFAVSDFGVGYDYDSVLHYSRRAFSRNGQDTIVPKQAGASIGQRTGLSQKDSDKLNKMYCDAGSDSPAEEEVATKRPTKKKNKPFQGRGLGYHQGKAVIIELPAAKTVQLRYSPMYQMFDDFSQPPQALPPPQFTGFRELLSSPEYIPIYIDDTNSYKIHDTPKSFGTDMEFKENLLQNVSTGVSKKLDGNQEMNIENKNNESLKTSDDNKPQNVDISDQPGNVLNDAFKQLEKIIHTHVYPSQPTHLKPYIDKIKQENLIPELKESLSDGDRKVSENSEMQGSDEHDKPYSFIMNNHDVNPFYTHIINNSQLNITNKPEIRNVERISYIKEIIEHENDTENDPVLSNFDHEKSNEIESVFDDSLGSQYETDFDKRLASILDSYITYDDYDIHSPKLNEESESSESVMDTKNVDKYESHFYPYKKELTKQYKFHYYPSFDYYKDWLNK